MSKASEASQASMKEMFYVSRGKQEDWGIDGYKAPKPCLYFTREHKFPGEKRKDITYQVQATAKDPAPTAYALDDKLNAKLYWTKSSGKFLYGKRNTLIDEVMKRKSYIPSPSQYFEVPKSQTNSEQKFKKLPGGKFSKTSGVNFITTVQYESEQKPDIGAHSPTYQLLENKAPVWSMGKPKPSKAPSKQEVGPGKYHDGFSKSQKLIKKNSETWSFGKSKPVNVIGITGKITQGFPAVGAYKDIENAYTKKIVHKKDRTPNIHPYKFKRFNEEIAKSKQYIPGPGSYEIGPPSKKKGN